MLGMQWRIQGEGLGGLPPLFLDQTEAQRAEKNFFAYRTPPPYLRFWIFTTPPPPLPPPALFQGLDPALVCIQINGGCLVGQLTNQ